MARTPLAARILIDPAFSDGYESNQSGEGGGRSLVEAEIQSPIDLPSRTPTHIRFAESEQSQLVEHQTASRSSRNFESRLIQRTAMSDIAEEISRLRSEISEMRRISPVGEILNHQSGGEIELRVDSSGPTSQEESPGTAPNNLITQQVIAASSDINSTESRNATSTVMMDRRVPFSKYCSIAPTSTEIAKKRSVSNKDKTFDNLEMLKKALRASNLLSIVDGTRKPPDVTPTNSSGYTPEVIMPLIRADGTRAITVIAEDDCYKFYADSIVAFTFMMSMIDKDMHHMLSGAIREENPTKVYQVIHEHFKGGKNHHIESARRKLSAHRFGPDIERDLSRLLVLISELEVAQKMELPESQKFGILRTIISFEERPHVKTLFGLAIYHGDQDLRRLGCDTN